MEIIFSDQARDQDLTYVVVVSHEDGKWLLCHSEEEKWAFPSGPRKPDERIYQTAQRLLREKAGVTDAQLEPVTAYSLSHVEGEEASGALLFAEVRDRGAVEGTEVQLLDTSASKSLLPAPQAGLLEKTQQWLDEGGFVPEEEVLFGIMF